MCTVSVVPGPRGWRLMCNRDERRQRRPAEPPRLRACGERRSVWPRDPESGGTWIGANDAGLVLALLNRSRPERAFRPAVSRGVVIPALLRTSDLDEAVASARALVAGTAAPRFDDFTLLIIHGGTLARLEHRRGAVACDRQVLRRPLFFTSSSLGDQVVDGPRRRLFERLLATHADLLAAQAAFHRHQWPGRRDISVVMARLEAATVSRTTIDVPGPAIAMGYAALAADHMSARCS